MLNDKDLEFLRQIQAKGRKRELGPLPADLEVIRLRLFDLAAESMARREQIPPTAVFFLRSGLVVPMILTGDASDKARDGFANQIRVLTAALETVCVAVIMEVWAAFPKEGLAEAAEKGVRDRDDKQEVVLITAEWTDTATMWAYRIGRNADGDFESFLEGTGFDEIHGKPTFGLGRFTNLLPARPVPDEWRKRLRSAFKSDFVKIFDADDAAQAKLDNRLN